MLQRFNSVLLHDTLPVDLLDLLPSDILISAFVVFNPGDLYWGIKKRIIMIIIIIAAMVFFDTVVYVVALVLFCDFAMLIGLVSYSILALLNL